MKLKVYIKKNKITNKIREGSYGVVYLAYNIYTKQKVAIKRIVKKKMKIKLMN